MPIGPHSTSFFSPFHGIDQLSFIISALHSSSFIIPFPSFNRVEEQMTEPTSASIFARRMSFRHDRSVHTSLGQLTGPKHLTREEDPERTPASPDPVTNPKVSFQVPLETKETRGSTGCTSKDGRSSSCSWRTLCPTHSSGSSTPSSRTSLWSTTVFAQRGSTGAL